MILGCRFLTNVADVNHFDSAQSAEFAEGDTPLVYVQLVDRSRCPASENWKPPGFRYSPAGRRHARRHDQQHRRREDADQDLHPAVSWGRVHLADPAVRH
jgi:hypothetical protein